MERTRFFTSDYALTLKGFAIDIKNARDLAGRSCAVASYHHYRDDFLISDDYVYPVIDRASQELGEQDPTRILARPEADKFTYFGLREVD